MKRLLFSSLVFLLSCGGLRADLTVVNKIEGGLQSGEMTMKIKGDRARVDVTPSLSMIIDGKTGDTLTLMHDQKSYLRISGESTKALLDQVRQMQPKAADGAPVKGKLTPLGEKVRISNYQTEHYRYETGNMVVDYWLAPDFPDYKAIMAEMQQFQGEGLATLCRDLAPPPDSFPGFPIRTKAVTNGQTVTSTVVSVTRDEVDAAELEPPQDYQAIKAPLMPPANP